MNELPLRIKKHAEISFSKSGPEPNLLTSWGECVCGWKGPHWYGIDLSGSRYDAEKHKGGRHDHKVFTHAEWSYVDGETNNQSA